MSSHRTLSWKALALAGLLCSASCLGPNHATGHLYNWNRSPGNRWAQTGLFFVLVPAYVVFFASDNLIFNPIQWWSGTNVINKPEPVDDFDFKRAVDEGKEGGSR